MRRFSLETDIQIISIAVAAGKGGHGSGNLLLPVLPRCDDAGNGLGKIPADLVQRELPSVSGKPAKTMHVERECGRKVKIGLKNESFRLASPVEPSQGFVPGS